MYKQLSACVSTWIDAQRQGKWCNWKTDSQGADDQIKLRILHTRTVAMQLCVFYRRGRFQMRMGERLRIRPSGSPTCNVELSEELEAESVAVSSDGIFTPFGHLRKLSFASQQTLRNWRKYELYGSSHINWSGFTIWRYTTPIRCGVLSRRRQADTQRFRKPGCCVRNSILLCLSPLGLPAWWRNKLHILCWQKMPKPQGRRVRSFTRHPICSLAAVLDSQLWDTWQFSSRLFLRKQVNKSPCRFMITNLTSSPTPTRAWTFSFICSCLPRVQCRKTHHPRKKRNERKALSCKFSV